MKSGMSAPHRMRELLLGLCLASLAAPASAATIGYWRMEADLDPSANGVRVANEVAGGSDLLSNEAFIDFAANPNGTVPNTGSINLGSIGSRLQGGGNGINGTIASYSALDATSLTAEFWARTGEGQATLLQRSSGANGFTIANPNALSITYHVSNGAGGSVAITLNTGHNMDATWRHYAFTYDQATGVGSFYVDGAVVASSNGVDGRALYWGGASTLLVGQLMDYASAFNGTMDEVRLSNVALPSTQFLGAVAEPASALLLGLAFAAAFRQARGARR
jgi:concanavalin A-like lectin/glucanase superfamily protein